MLKCVIVTVLLNYGLVIEKIKQRQIKYKEIAVLQFLWETQWATSTVYQHNNCFGFKYRKKYADYRIPGSAYGGYLTIDRSIDHYQELQTIAISKYHIRSEKDYLAYLDKYYSQEKNRSYSSCLTKVKTRLLKLHPHILQISVKDSSAVSLRLKESLLPRGSILSSPVSGIVLH